ncbi:MAG: AraC family transcriptional regulator [Bacteroidales bacterium]|nr:AraC family transcriptional regulator [Bacteroidales bacterium]
MCQPISGKVNLSVAEVAERLGFATPSFFIHFFHKNTGTTPLQFRKGR